FLELALDRVKNGLSYVLLGSMYLVSGISGSKAADMAAIVPVLFPEMKRRGADEGELVSLLAASGAMAETIPPSIILISIGVITGVSISSLFTGGLVPAAIGAVALAFVVFIKSRNGTAAPRRGASVRQVARAFVVALPALVLPLVIRAAVVDGVATATEVATVGIVYCSVCGPVFYRSFPLQKMFPALVTTASLSGAIMFIIGMATAMGWSLTQAGFADQLASVMTHIPGGRAGFMAVSIVLFAILGSVLEGFPAIVLFGPLLFPIAQTLGINEVQYTMVAVLSMSLGLFAPPVGIGFYSACAVSGVSPDKGVKHIWVYLGALALAVILVAAVPW
ncbi:MAG: TRAP transporter large permease subunit, partial [Vulcanimicrobiaceae bacterium]